jgi:predicted MFS family arabinose efflux permease
LLATLKQRDFGLLWFGGLVSYTGNWATIAAIPFFVFEQTGSAFASGAVLTAMSLPLLFSSVAGTFVDRWDRKRTLAVANVVMAAAVLPMLLASSGNFIWVVHAAVLAVASVNLFAYSAENALLPRLVGRDRLMAANSLNSLNDNLARVAGPAVGGALVAQAGLAAVVVFDAVSFLVAAGLVSLIRADAAPEEGPEEVDTETAERPLPAVWREWVAGLRLLTGRRVVLIVFLVAAAATLADSILSALLAPFVGDVLNAGASIFGLVLTLRGVGGIAGGAVAGYASRWLPPERTLGWSLVLIGLLGLVLANVPVVAVALALFAVAGVVAVPWLASQQTLLQTNVEDRYLGRAFGAFNTANAVTLLLGSLFAGALADLAGIVPLLNSSALLYCGAGLLALFLLTPGKDRKTTD